MTPEEKNIHRNKLIITICVLVVVFLLTVPILLNSTKNDFLYFHPVHSGKTGEPLGVISSILLYMLLLLLLGMFPSSIVFLFVMCLYFFLHRKDPNIWSRSYHPKYEEEFSYGGSIAFIVPYAMAFLLMLMHISNYATIRVIP